MNTLERITRLGLTVPRLARALGTTPAILRAACREGTVPPEVDRWLDVCFTSRPKVAWGKPRGRPRLPDGPKPRVYKSRAKPKDAPR